MEFIRTMNGGRRKIIIRGFNEERVIYDVLIFNNERIDPVIGCCMSRVGFEMRFNVKL